MCYPDSFLKGIPSLLAICNFGSWVYPQGTRLRDACSKTHVCSFARNLGSGEHNAQFYLPYRQCDLKPIYMEIWTCGHVILEKDATPQRTHWQLLMNLFIYQRCWQRNMHKHLCTLLLGKKLDSQVKNSAKAGYPYFAHLPLRRVFCSFKVVSKWLDSSQNM